MFWAIRTKDRTGRPRHGCHERVTGGLCSIEIQTEVHLSRVRVRGSALGRGVRVNGRGVVVDSCLRDLVLGVKRTTGTVERRNYGVQSRYSGSGDLFISHS